MKKSALKIETDEISCGIYTKRNAAELIIQGCRHVHSTLLARRDMCFDVTETRLAGSPARDYPWEEKGKAKTITIHSSKERHDVIRQAVAGLKAGPNRDLREKILGVLEELITNSIYHPYKDDKGAAKYHRSKPAFLGEKEWLTVKFYSDERGVYLSVSDQGGTLNFDDVRNAFERCYGDQAKQIDDKESGAGLGTYMIFEAVTHLKITVQKGVSTEFSCWISDKKHFDPEYFSFNFFTNLTSGR